MDGGVPGHPRGHSVGRGGVSDEIDEKNGDQLALFGLDRSGLGQGDPHEPQNRNPSGFSWPHSAQTLMPRMFPQRRIA